MSDKIYIWLAFTCFLAVSLATVFAYLELKDLQDTSFVVGAGPF